MSEEKIFKSESFLKFQMPFCPIKEIRISDDKIVFVLKKKEYQYAWRDVLEASIVQKEHRGGMPTGWGIWIQKTCRLRTRDEVFEFGVSGRRGEIGYSPNFKDTKNLLIELKKHLDLKEGKVHRFKRLPTYTRTVICLVFIVLIKIKFYSPSVLWIAFSTALVFCSIYENSHKHK